MDIGYLVASVFLVILLVIHLVILFFWIKDDYDCWVSENDDATKRH